MSNNNTNHPLPSSLASQLAPLSLDNKVPHYKIQKYHKLTDNMHIFIKSTILKLFISYKKY